MKKVVKIEKTYYPNAENAKVYQDLYDKWRKVYAVQLALANEGLTKNMWAAPGV
jgi:autoinducer 2 (AI-2) kinase